MLIGSRLWVILALFSWVSISHAANPLVKLETNKGAIVLELAADKAPNTVENFLRYVNEGFYQDTIFHRVIDNFMIQGGGFTVDFMQKPTHEPIANEADNGLKNMRGTIAMARTADPHSATAQFFINVKDNPFLDFRAKDIQGWGYTVFGEVIEGMGVIDAIKAVQTRSGGPFRTDVPNEPIIIKNVTLVTKADIAAPVATDVPPAAADSANTANTAPDAPEAKPAASQ